MLFRKIRAKIAALFATKAPVPDPDTKAIPDPDTKTIFEDQEELIAYIGAKIPEGVASEETELIDIMDGIVNYMGGLTLQHRAEVQALIGETRNPIIIEDRGIPLRRVYANGDELRVKLCKAHRHPLL